jgi:elongation factor G
MNQRRARIQTMEGRGRNSVVKAYVPLAEMLNYAPSLKSITGGKGSYSMEFHRYEQVPSHMQDKLVVEISRLKAGDD